MVRYYGHYSNVARGKRKKEDTDNDVPCIIEPEDNVKVFRKNWARLIQKIYEVGPLVCPKCKGTMRVISFIENPSVIREILMHLGLWPVRSRPPPKMRTPSHYPNSKLLILTHSLRTSTPAPIPVTPGMIIFNTNVLTNIKTGRDAVVRLNSG